MLVAGLQELPIPEFHSMEIVSDEVGRRLVPLPSGVLTCYVVRMWLTAADSRDSTTTDTCGRVVPIKQSVRFSDRLCGARPNELDTPQTSPPSTCGHSEE